MIEHIFYPFLAGVCFTAGMIGGCCAFVLVVRKDKAESDQRLMAQNRELMDLHERRAVAVERVAKAFEQQQAK